MLLIENKSDSDCKGRGGKERPVKKTCKTEPGATPDDPIKREKYVEGKQPFDELTKGRAQIDVGFRGTLPLIPHQ